jgi:predicted alpha/beta superfamily hydrolase
VQITSPLSITGDACGLSWSNVLPLTILGNDTFQAQLNCGKGTNTFNFKVKMGDTWSIGANYHVSPVPSVGGELTVYPWFTRTSGTYKNILSVFSPQLSNNRNLVVYLPASHLENPLRPFYPTLVMHDGQNLFNASTAFGGVSWDCQPTLDGLIAQGSMEPIVVVGVDNTPDRIAEYTYSVDPEYGGGKGDLYLDFLKQTVLTLVRKSFPIAPAQMPSQLAILGSSLGGLISCYAGWTRPHEYGRTGCMSSSFWWNGQDFKNKIMASRPAPTPKQSTFYIDSGNEGPSKDGYTDTLDVANHFLDFGFTPNVNIFYYLADGAEHNEYYWGKRFYKPMLDLFPIPVLSP